MRIIFVFFTSIIDLCMSFANSMVLHTCSLPAHSWVNFYFNKKADAYCDMMKSTPNVVNKSCGSTTIAPAGIKQLTSVCSTDFKECWQINIMHVDVDDANFAFPSTRGVPFLTNFGHMSDRVPLPLSEIGALTHFLSFLKINPPLLI